jgi:hypothetical protein
MLVQSSREGMGDSRSKRILGTLLPRTEQRRRQSRVDPVRVLAWSCFFMAVFLVWIVIGWAIVRQL